MKHSMLLMLFAMAGLNLLVWLRLYQLRIQEMQQKRVHMQKLHLSGPKAVLMEDTRASDNFRNLFELPVLFYVAALLVIYFNVQDTLLLSLGWSFVILRVLHSLIHCTYNLVLHRFTTYFSGAVCLWLLWARLAYLLLA
jgi:hypothetical protein